MSLGRLGLRFILLLILLCIRSATGGAVVSDGQPPPCDCDDASGSGSGGSAMDMVHCRNALRHQLLHEVAQTIERADRFQNDTRSLQAEITDALVHLRSAVSEQSSSSSSSSMETRQMELHAGLAAFKAAVGAGMARLEAFYRSQGDAVDRLREMRRRLQLDAVGGQRQGQNGGGGGGDDYDGDLGGFQAQARALEESIGAQSMAVLEALESLRALHAEISAAMDRVLVLVQYSAQSCNYSFSGPYNWIR